MSSVFTKIINGELPSYKIYEDERSFAFLALDQINLGHVLVVPKKEVDHFFDVESEDYKHIFMLSKVIAKSIKKVTNCVRVGVGVQGFEVAHVHIHLIPLWEPKEFSFSRAKRREAAEMEEIKNKIIEFLDLKELN